MRILLAIDGSDCSHRAVELVAGCSFPADSTIRVIGVHQPYADVLAYSWAAVGDAGVGRGTEEETSIRKLREAIAGAELALQREGIKVEGFLVHGRPGSAIVDEAKSAEVDLVVVGSRGHGTIATMLLGSTASEVVDHAPCPVLVARRPTLGPIAFADDGSSSARNAESVFTDWSIFSGERITVLTVADLAVPVAAGFTPGLYDQVLESYTKSVDTAREEVREEASTEAHRLAAAGHDATPYALEGDPAGEILRFVAENDIATIVMGSRGHTGLARLILGSVARNVLLHAPCSVLVVRDRR